MSHYQEKGKNENKPNLGKIKKMLFPFSMEKMDKSFSYFLLKLFLALLILFTSAYFFVIAYKGFIEGENYFLLYLYGLLLAFDVYILINFISQFFRYTQFIFRFFKKNPLLNEKTSTFLLAGVNNQIVEMNTEPDFYKKQKEFKDKWKTLGELVSCIVLFLPRLFILAFNLFFSYIRGYKG